VLEPFGEVELIQKGKKSAIVIFRTIVGAREAVSFAASPQGAKGLGGAPALAWRRCPFDAASRLCAICAKNGAALRCVRWRGQARGVSGAALGPLGGPFVCCILSVAFRSVACAGAAEASWELRSVDWLRRPTDGAHRHMPHLPSRA
jgi:hypothetical protein